MTTPYAPARYVAAPAVTPPVWVASERAWRPIPGHEGYEVSGHGEVRSLDRWVYSEMRSPQRRRGTMLVPFRKRGGHLEVRLAQGAHLTVHRAVLEAFLGPAPVGHIGCHRNDVANDNRLENLYWGTHSDNKYDAVRNGRHACANKTHCKRGHRLSGDNLRVGLSDGGRYCKACAKINMDAFKARQAASKKENIS